MTELEIGESESSIDKGLYVCKYVYVCLGRNNATMGAAFDDCQEQKQKQETKIRNEKNPFS